MASCPASIAPPTLGEEGQEGKAGGSVPALPTAPPAALPAASDDDSLLRALAAEVSDGEEVAAGDDDDCVGPSPPRAAAGPRQALKEEGMENAAPAPAAPVFSKGAPLQTATAARPPPPRELGGLAARSGAVTPAPVGYTEPLSGIKVSRGARGGGGRERGGQAWPMQRSRSSLNLLLNPVSLPLS